VVDTNKK